MKATLPQIKNTAVVATVHPNGDLDTPAEKRQRYHFYRFAPARSIDDKFLASVATTLGEASHANIGELMLAIGRKLIGARDLASWAVQYLDDENELRLVASRDGKKWLTLGTLNPE